MMNSFPKESSQSSNQVNHGSDICSLTEEEIRIVEGGTK